MKRYETIEDIPKRLRVMKKRLKQSLALVVILVITLSLSGCEKFVESDVSAETKSTIQTISETTSSENITEIKTIEPPEDGWTLDQLNEVLYLNGQQIRLPLMFSTLEGEYEIKEKEYYGDPKHASGVLYYNNQFVAIISFYELDNDFKITNLCFTSAYDKSEQIYSNYFMMNGFGLKDNISKIQKCLGNKYVKDSGFYKFIVGNDEYTILVTDVEEDYMIMLFEGVNKND